jgi:hypothetical protein
VADLRILAGNPTADELAAVTVVLRAAGTADAEPPADPPPSRWRLSARPTVPGRAGRGAWRASAFPVP